MWPPSDRPARPALLGAAGLLALALAGAAQTAGTNAPPAVQLTVQREFIPNAGPVARGQLLSRDHRLAFLFPPNTIARSDAAQGRASFVARDNSYSLTLQLHEAAAAPPSAEAWRAQLAARHPELRELAAFTCHGFNTNGPAVDFAWRAAGVQRLLSRAALLPLPGGHVEITLVADETQFETAKHRLNSFLLTMRRSAPGEPAQTPVVVPD